MMRLKRGESKVKREGILLVVIKNMYREIEVCLFDLPEVATTF